MQNLKEVIDASLGWSRLLKDAYTKDDQQLGHQEFTPFWRLQKKFNLAVDDFSAIESDLNNMDWPTWVELLRYVESDYSDVIDQRDATEVLVGCIQLFVGQMRLSGLADVDLDEWSPPEPPPPPPPPADAWAEGSIASLGTPIDADNPVPAHYHWHWPTKPSMSIAMHDGQIACAWVSGENSTSCYPAQLGGRIFISLLESDGQGGYTAKSEHKEIPSLGHLMGMCSDERNHLYIATCIDEHKNEHSEVKKIPHRDGIINIIKLDTGGNIVQEATVNLEGKYGSSISCPMDFGQASLSYGGGLLCLHFSKDTNIAWDGKRHQHAIAVRIDAETLELSGRVHTGLSHSFAQMTFWDGDRFINLEESDTARGINIGEIGRRFGVTGPEFEQDGHTYTQYSSRTHSTVWASKGGKESPYRASNTLYQVTHCHTGGLAIGDEGYLVAFSAENGDGNKTDGVKGEFVNHIFGSYNVALAHVKKDFLNSNYYDFESKYVSRAKTTDRNPNAKSYTQFVEHQWHAHKDRLETNEGIVFLTTHTGGENHAGQPRICRVSDGYIVIWQEYSMKECLGAKAMKVDEFGNEILPVRPIDATWHKGNYPVVHEDKMVWMHGEDFPAGIICYTLDKELNLIKTTIS